MFSLVQYTAARESAAIFDRSRQGRIEITGADRLSFLHALLTNDIAQLVKGAGTYAAYLTPQGRMISDMRVIEIGDRILMNVEGPVASALAVRLDKLVFSEDVQVRDISGELSELCVHGPAAAAVIERATGINVSQLAHDHHNLAVGTQLIVRNDALGVLGFDLVVPHSERQSLWLKLIEAGAVEAGEEVYETMRIEAGRPRFGVDMDTETIPLEAGIEGRAISFSKGCYVGQEVIVRVMHRGHGRVARRLVRLMMSGGAPPRPGDTIYASGKDSGHITSAAQSPKAGSAIALGYVHRDLIAPGTAVTVNGLDGRVDEPIN